MTEKTVFVAILRHFSTRFCLWRRQLPRLISAAVPEASSAMLQGKTCVLYMRLSFLSSILIWRMKQRNFSGFPVHRIYNKNLNPVLCMNKEKHRLYTKIRIKPVFMAERVGFEPTCPWRPTVFETFLRNGLSWKMGENSRLFWKWKRLDKAGFLRRFYPQSRMKSSEFESFAEMAQNGGKKAKWREFGKKGEKKERISALEV